MAGHKRERNSFYGFQHFAVDTYRLADAVVTFLYQPFGAGIIFLILAHPVYKM